jgi:two-component system, sensor histidine kinase and response regulator
MTPMPVLINVDDHEGARYARSRILSSAGFQVHDAGTGRQTLDLAEKHRPDLVLLDVHLPDLDGVEVCRRLKLLRQDTSVMVLQISASALSAAHAKEALDAGADAYLMEPVDPDVLVATVKALLRLHQAERALVHANRQLEILNKELQRSNQDLQQFAIAASHDLQDPLRTMSIYTQLIMQELGDTLSDQHRGYLKWVSDGTTRMQTLIRDLLAYSQVGREGRSQSIIELDGVVSAAISQLSEPMQAAGGVIEIPRPLPSVWGDFSNLVSLFHNVLSNSLKYRAPERDLAIQIEAVQSSAVEWTIRVTDNGIGISKDYHEHIFRPFKRLHGFGIPGTGVGLALCQRIVEDAGGRIWVESVPNEGSTFCFTLRAA